MKKLIWLVILAGCAGFFFPVLNLFLDVQPLATLPVPAEDSPKAALARQILEHKCLHCHFPGVGLPYYANFPLAKPLIQKDVNKGMEYVNFKEALQTENGKPVSEVALAQIEYATETGSMPPLQYLAMHWSRWMDGASKAAVLGWIHEVREKYYAVPDAAPEFRDHALQPIPAQVEVDLRKVMLGKKLYHDKRLSKDETISCATCHDLAKGGTDREKVSTGIKGQQGPINAPTVYNAGFQILQFWDGRAKDLEEQAGGPVENPKEMGATWDEVIPKLNQDLIFAAEFKGVYPDGFSAKNIQNAIAEFEKTLITPNSRFDRFLKGDATALSEEAFIGFRIFMEKGCFTCHVGKAMGGQSFEKMGREKDYFQDRGTPVTEADQGRFNVTKDPKDLHKFKVPMLRNIAKTAPYFHDGSASDLKEAVKVMARYQTAEGMTADEVGKTARFLEALTGEYEGRPLE